MLPLNMFPYVITAIGLVSHITIIVSQPMVNVEQGTVLGKTVPFQSNYLDIDTEIDVYLGIPYAEPPVGSRRFKPPVPKVAWTKGEVYDATYPRDICVQTSAEADYYMNVLSAAGEDCLHLNVYVKNPKPSSAAAAAVMVFIHGGGFLYGNGYDGFYSGLPLAAVGDVVVVTMNYRLGIMGFLSDGDDSLPGNYGMLDQVEALRWIKNNIQAFGGDPNMITIFGESAGASSVSAHLFSPLSRDLFNQGILESGSIFAPFAWSPNYDQKAQRNDALQVGAELGCSAIDSGELLSCLQMVDAERFINIIVYPRLIIDGVFLPKSPKTMLENQDFKKCRLINGFNNDEGTLEILSANGLSRNKPNITADDFEFYLGSSLSTYLTNSNDVILDSIRNEYVDWSIADDPEADYFDIFKNMAGDYTFSCPAVMETRAHVLAAGDGGDDAGIYQYLFTHTPSVSGFAAANGTIGPSGGWLGAGHYEEVAFVFGYPFDLPRHLAGYSYTEEEKAMSLRMMMYWTNFAKTGNPNIESMTSQPYNDERAWPAFTIPGLRYKDIAVELSDGEGLRANECHFWNVYLDKLNTFSADRGDAEAQWREDFYTWKYNDLEDWRHEFSKYQAARENGQV